MYNPWTRTSEKCIGCYPAVEQGIQPQCVVNCIGKIRVMGFINPPWTARKDNPVDFLVHEKQIALPYYPQLGLEPNIYYIPPIHADPAYLEQMFGPRVHEAIERYKAIHTDPIAAGLLCLIGSSERILHSFAVKGGMAIGYDTDGSEIVRVPVTESIFERPAYDEKIGAVRNNTP
jgi:nitrate reductase beta subunit